MSKQLLLVKDVPHLGRSGDLVNVKPGFGRNYLMPKGLAVVADKGTIQLQKNLLEERQKRALEDKKDSEEIAARLGKLVVETTVKVDPEGNMYGSVTAADLASFLQQQGSITLDKTNLVLPHPIKTLGMHTIEARLKEGVTGSFSLKVLSEQAAEEASQDESA